MSTLTEPEVSCPLCRVAADRQSLCCPSCREDLSVLFRLRYAARIDYNRALDALEAGDAAAARCRLRGALEAEPGLNQARELLESLSVAGSGGVAAAGRESDTPSE
ncbi:hypothetical protein BX285_3510 [Streptomyces sp. 1114.5]|uniref:hypothetical protein n=1 Tax=unclassified Streptomyces TaxID=2593676 RepID=UPI000BCA9445|nr:MULTISPECIES: hypothetical protein [unclassified Streptomyces]RKT19065.1 hypothetical protein BX285_3510 [Streptomyces sp. 1114.5]SOB85270.1 hypothetical protein SAMN06272789_5546 [Streptomyces sp. 1331.2]